MAHTPGPWEIEIDDDLVNEIRICSGKSGIAKMYRSGLMPRLENAKLISAAPDLLAALEACITDDGARAMTDESRNATHTARRRLDEITRIARAAIAKAKGEV